MSPRIAVIFYSATGNVAALDPTGRVKVGSTITLAVWGAAPPPPETDDTPEPSDDSGKKKDKPDHAGKPGKGKHD